MYTNNNFTISNKHIYNPENSVTNNFENKLYDKINNNSISPYKKYNNPNLHNINKINFNNKFNFNEVISTEDFMNNLLNKKDKRDENNNGWVSATTLIKSDFNNTNNVNNNSNINATFVPPYKPQVNIALNNNKINKGK